MQVALAILVVQKTRQTMVPALHYALWNAAKFETRKSGHVRQDHSLPARNDQYKSCPALILGANALSEIAPDTFFLTAAPASITTTSSQSCRVLR